MSKRTIARLWIAGLVVLVVGLAAGGVGLGLMLAYGGHFESAGGTNYRFIPTLDALFWTTVGVMAAGFTIAIAGGIVQLAAWIGALVNTNLLADKTWFIVLLVGGVLGLSFGLLGFAAMVAYLVAGPDGMRSQRPNTPPSDPRPAASPPLG
jgi:hypothetical protein